MQDALSKAQASSNPSPYRLLSLSPAASLHLLCLRPTFRVLLTLARSHSPNLHCPMSDHPCYRGWKDSSGTSSLPKPEEKQHISYVLNPTNGLGGTATGSFGNAVPSTNAALAKSYPHYTQEDKKSFNLVQSLPSARPLGDELSQSLRILNLPTSTVNTHQSSYLAADTRLTDPVTSESGISTPPAGGWAAYFPTVPPAPPLLPNMIRTDFRRPCVNFPSAPSSQRSMQIMAIRSEQGPPVRIPVDVRTGSKVADEKRRRNAGASARSRARRKEREREICRKISKLKEQLCYAREDVEYYQSERDFFKSIVLQQLCAERLCVRPLSPRLIRRSSAPSNAVPDTGGSSGDLVFVFDGTNNH